MLKTLTINMSAYYTLDARGSPAYIKMISLVEETMIDIKVKSFTCTLYFESNSRIV